MVSVDPGECVIAAGHGGSDLVSEFIEQDLMLLAGAFGVDPVRVSVRQPVQVGPLFSVPAVQFSQFSGSGAGGWAPGSGEDGGLENRDRRPCGIAARPQISHIDIQCGGVVGVRGAIGALTGGATGGRGEVAGKTPPQGGGG